MEEIKKGNNEFFMDKEGEKAAVIQWVPEGKNLNGRQLITIHHTEVGSQLKGQGAGRALVEKVVEYARKENLSVRATCSFAKKVLDETKKFHDVLPD
ncbi:putative GNAT family acetyltransferase [Peribacillus deserti]|uniref:GNAT family acetyltransferase n=1 Tax=Peribacillus deserti TaxID=673318 RepID=A0ABS2QL89_9BACI|nr:GNAT family N-acetyltransferase [Peribacillus deserti]MBM7693937.1 putative GNAT family acetyltransferase [Peribacillus deserti]